MTDTKKPVLEPDTRKQQGVVFGRERKPVTESMLNRMELGRAYWDWELNDIQGDKARKTFSSYAAKIVQMMKIGTGLWISGPTGRGKTTAAAIIAKEASRWGYSVLFTTADKIRDAKPDNTDFDGSAKRFQQKLVDVELLVVDNLDDEFLTDRRFGPKNLEKLVKERNAKLYPTIVTSAIHEWEKKPEMAALLECQKETMPKVVITGVNFRDGVEKQRLDEILSEKDDKNV